MDETGLLARWTGWDLRGSGADDPTVVASATDTLRAAAREHGGRAYELLAVAGRGFRPPRFVSVLPAAVTYKDLRAGPVAERLRTTWSVEYREIATLELAAGRTHAIYLLGVDPPDDATDAELVEFNDFYTNEHLVEVAQRRGALRAVRHELAALDREPYPSAPRFLAAYEVDEAGSDNRRHTGPPYAKGPDVWQRHTTPWRLWFTLLEG